MRERGGWRGEVREGRWARKEHTGAIEKAIIPLSPSSESTAWYVYTTEPTGLVCNGKKMEK